ncbi:LysE family translocator [Afifella sp. IM 167]|uniref:LysE family translocator n=1 Tax=Afifella sp. IM 167 TaxID=2033586 RepID=UPI001CCA3291|nr:LysE family translocator [Afifella sp. IM 167]MBZ8135015.1 lysine transporter LysE [Afifella sp. IM 167]
MSIEFLLTSLLIVLVPGTGVVYTIAAGLTGGRRAGLIAAFACTLGIVPHLAASILGLAALLHASATLFAALKYLGVAYLLYLAVTTLRNAGPLALTPAARAERKAREIVRTGILINFLNPKLSIFFVAFLPQFVPAEGGTSLQLLALSGVFMAMTFVVFVFYGVFAALVRQKVIESARAMAWMRRATALAFAGFGLRLAFAER